MTVITLGPSATYALHVAHGWNLEASAGAGGVLTDNAAPEFRRWGFTARAGVDMVWQLTAKCAATGGVGYRLLTLPTAFNSVTVSLGTRACF